MLEKPDLSDKKIINCLDEVYGLLSSRLTFLPAGADSNTAVYRLIAEDEMPYFLKLRAGAFDELSVALPKFYRDQGSAHIIPPLTTKTGRLWGSLDSFTTILYPYVEGRDGYEVGLSDQQWVEFGAALRNLHATIVPKTLVDSIRWETYSPHWREMVKMFMASVEVEAFSDPSAIELAMFLKVKSAEILDLVRRAERLARKLQGRSLEYIVCHSDLHAGNLLIGAQGEFYIVDWDDPILAPKERDLMYIGAGLLGSWRTPQEEETLFYQGYGQTQIDLSALVYYRYERIIQDIAAYCEQLLLTDRGGADRVQALEYLKSNFLPNGTIELAYNSDPALRER